MPTMAVFDASVATLLTDAPYTWTRSVSDWRVDRDRPDPGPLFQLRMFQTELDESQSAIVGFEIVKIELAVHRYLQDTDAERTYVISEMGPDLLTLLDRATWKAVAGVKKVIEGPELTGPPTLNLRVMSYTVELTIEKVAA